ncbi:hypothetical protein P280DRAFT_544778 [Massarina eburnea CBS 473.64]|uniref:Zn(2)-C6 fungal-type domain-containing protein n=1 Tax=Massarina eburnea CBS 473.64 TaxID=1395130 RepID=A0A6A6SJL5_9PLEO|nr:hypothetical protein P280DRAFT_544778 [Massarina eburnea CBS 473.64]
MVGSTPADRRNGKPASCEPCRLNKTKCDHAYPKCDRCVQRGIVDKCFYHPAPLTKQRTADNEGSRQKEPSSSRPVKRKRIYAPVPDTFGADPFSQNGKFTDAVAVETYRPGYLGPTSYEANLPKDELSPILHNREASVESETDLEMAHQHPLTKSMRMQMTTDILKTFRYYSTIKELVVWHGLHCQAGTIPLPFDVGLIQALQPTVDRYNLTHSVPDPRLVTSVLENSSKPLEITQSLKACDFHRTCTGDNIRLETIGVLLATAGRALSFGSCSHLINDQTNPGLRSKLVDELLRASTSCVILCSMITPVNDLLTWLLFDNYYLTIMVCGFSAPPSYRRMGELNTQIYALGVHRESNTPNLPAWLLETRRRIFCSSYMQDKTISTFLGRPIRMSKRHTDIKMPLDLSDEELMADEATFNKAVGRLDANGWNTGGRYLRASWVRIRYISSQFLEEILDFALVKVNENVEEQLLDISTRIHSAWTSFPSHLHYDPHCWSTSLLPGICLMLVVVHQTHWYTEFMIRKLLAHTQPLTSNLELLRVSTSLLSNTLTLGRLRDWHYDVQKDFLMQVILFGIPSASILASALQEQQRTTLPFPPSISRAEIIRMLSVLISHLEAAAHLDSSNARPGEANYNLCRKACKAFTKVMDNVLDPKPKEGSDIAPTSADLDLDLDLGLDLDIFAAPGLEAFEGIDFSGVSELGGGGGDDGIDWGTMVQWTM